MCATPQKSLANAKALTALGKPGRAVRRIAVDTLGAARLPTMAADGGGSSAQILISRALLLGRAWPALVIGRVLIGWCAQAPLRRFSALSRMAPLALRRPWPYAGSQALAAGTIGSVNDCWLLLCSHCLHHAASIMSAELLLAGIPSGSLFVPCLVPPGHNAVTRPIFRGHQLSQGKKGNCVAGRHANDRQNRWWLAQRKDDYCQCASRAIPCPVTFRRCPYRLRHFPPVPPVRLLSATLVKLALGAGLGARLTHPPIVALVPARQRPRLGRH